MSDIYHLRNDKSKITFEVQIGTIGNAGTVVILRRSGNSILPVISSKPDDAGNISLNELGVSADLIGAVLVVTTQILFGKKDDLDQAFTNLSMSVSVHGGLDGDQTYPIHDNEKTEFTDNRSIVVTKAVRLQIQ